MEEFFRPRSVAVIGASRDEAKLGYKILDNILKSGYKGDVYPINPKADEILGKKCYPKVTDISDDVDLAVVVVPAEHVIPVVDDCGRKGVKGVVVISAGFKESGAEGVKRERDLVRVVKGYGMRLIGPNCLGIIDTHCPLNASFAAAMPNKGWIAFISQSGALGTAILDWALAEGIGFSKFISIGNKADVGETELMEACAEDPNTKVIIIYSEGISDGRAFMEAALKVTKKKPVIVVKAGITSSGSRAASSHTGSLAGSAMAYEAAFRQCGVLKASSIEEMFDISFLFASQPLIAGNRIAIVTNAGGPGVIAADAIENFGLRLATLSPGTISSLRSILPPAANIYNPVDVLGDALADRYGAALDAVLMDENVDGVLAILTPQVVTQIPETAKAVVEISRKFDKTVAACFMGEWKIRDGIRILLENGIPNYPFPEKAISSMKAMVEYRRWLEKPLPSPERFPVDEGKARSIIDSARSEGRITLGDVETREILRAYGIAVPRSKVASTADEAVAQAEEIGFPVAMKIVSPDILHKTDVGGVKLNLQSPADVRDAFDLMMYRATKYMPEARILGVQIQEMVRGRREAIIGMSSDPQFGPMIMFGLGGVYVEAMKDVSFRIAPVSREEAEEMVREIRSYPLLAGIRGEPPADIEAIVDAILRVSQLSLDFPDIVELDINPLLVGEKGKGAVAVDSRIVLRS
jgi:acetyl coenzyme A synthetase (ADP forming)-like protein